MKSDGVEKTLPFKDDQHGKFKLNYEGLYLVNEVLLGGFNFVRNG